MECAHGIQLSWSEPRGCLAATEPGRSLCGPLSLTNCFSNRSWHLPLVSASQKARSRGAEEAAGALE